MRGVIRALAGAVVVAMVLGACTNTPDRNLHPQPGRKVAYVPLLHPFRNARLFMDTDTEAQRFRREQGAAWLEPITSHPQAHWLNGPSDLAEVPSLAQRARFQGTLLTLVAYWVPNRNCSSGKLGARSDADYQRWIGQLIADLGTTRAAIILEPDSVAADCFDARRAALLNGTVQRLAAAHQYVYLDAGHSRWKSPGDMAPRLLAAGIAHAQGFSINVANRETTQESYQWGRSLSDLVGGREFVIDTSRNGLGPPPDEPGRNDEWCNPKRQALGQAPTTATGMQGLAALLWIKPPGESDGICGGERTFGFSPTQARDLIANAAATGR